MGTKKIYIISLSITNYFKRQAKKFFFVYHIVTGEFELVWNFFISRKVTLKNILHNGKHTMSVKRRRNIDGQVISNKFSTDASQENI